MTNCEYCYCANCDRQFNRNAIEAENAGLHKKLEVAERERKIAEAAQFRAVHELDDVKMIEQRLRTTAQALVEKLNSEDDSEDYAEECIDLMNALEAK